MNFRRRSTIAVQVLLFALGVLYLPCPSVSLVTSSSGLSSVVAGDNDPATTAVRRRQQQLVEALAPPSGKLSLSPELNIQESTDPTVILLQSNAIRVLSERLRTVAKANSAWISGSLTTVQTFCAEQDLARGKIPGPIPVIYCGSGLASTSSSSQQQQHQDDDNNAMNTAYLQAVAATGAHGLIVPVLNGLPVESLEQITSNGWTITCQQALSCGLVPIPEVTLQHEAASNWNEEDVSRLVDRLTELTGAQLASLVLTVQQQPEKAVEDGKEKPTSDSDSQPSSLPPISKDLRRRVPIVGSVRVTVGENRMGLETARFKTAGYSGTLLRHECVPEALRYSKNIDLMGKFWTSCIGDLKSTRSKAFNFRAKNNMEKSQSEVWMNYMKEVNEAGAMGDERDMTGPPVDSAAGDYRGFA